VINNIHQEKLSSLGTKRAVKAFCIASLTMSGLEYREWHFLMTVNVMIMMWNPMTAYYP